MKKPPPPPGRGASLAGLESAIAERDEILKRMAVDKEREMVLRKFIAAQLFPKPTEGTNKIIRCGIEAKLVHSITRKILEPELLEKRDELIRKGVPVARLVEMNPRLILNEYRILTEPKRKLFDTVLEIKESETPNLEITS